MSDFCISRIEHYKMAAVTGVFRESSRDLKNYPHSDVEPTLSKENVTLIEIFDPKKSLSGQIVEYREKNNIKGRFTIEGKNAKCQTNVMSQCFFKLTDGFIFGLDRDDQIKAYEDCLAWFQQKYPSAAVVGAYVHFDEPNCGPHLHINFLPIYEKDGKKIFSTSGLFPGKEWGTLYQDSVHGWACDHFEHDFMRKRPGIDKAKHLSLPELKQAYRALESVTERLNIYEPVKLKFDQIDSIGKPALFGGFKVTEEELAYIRRLADSSLQADNRIAKLEKENRELQEKLNFERAFSKRILSQLRDSRLLLQRLKQWFIESNLLDTYHILSRGLFLHREQTHYIER